MWPDVGPSDVQIAGIGRIQHERVGLLADHFSGQAIAVGKHDLVGNRGRCAERGSH